jgi:hypothetical protein
MAKYKINGFLFDTAEEAQKAKKELDSIRYIQSRTKMNDPDVLLKLYDRLIEQEVFETPVGIEFLRGIQKYLYEVPQIRKENVAPIPIPNQEVDRVKEKKIARHEARENQMAEKKMIAEKKAAGESRYRKLFFATCILCAMLLAIVVGMFVITYVSGNSMDIYNYEQEIIDKYETWEQELEQREADVTEREKALQSQTEAGETGENQTEEGETEESQTETEQTEESLTGQ